MTELRQKYFSWKATDLPATVLLDDGHDLVRRGNAVAVRPIAAVEHAILSESRDESIQAVSVVCDVKGHVAINPADDTRQLAEDLRTVAEFRQKLIVGGLFVRGRNQPWHVVEHDSDVRTPDP